jgi:hypothetical protein
MRNLASLIAKYTKPPYNIPVPELRELFRLHRQGANAMAQYRRKKKKLGIN